MANALLYRGDINPVHVIHEVSNIKRNKTVRFADWVPTGFKVSISEHQSRSFYAD